MEIIAIVKSDWSNTISSKSLKSYGNCICKHRLHKQLRNLRAKRDFKPLANDVLMPGHVNHSELLWKWNERMPISIKIIWFSLCSIVSLCLYIDEPLVCVKYSQATNEIYFHSTIQLNFYRGVVKTMKIAALVWQNLFPQLYCDLKQKCIRHTKSIFSFF